MENPNRPRFSQSQKDIRDIDTGRYQRLRAKQNDVTADRALGTTYQNTSGKVILATVTLAQDSNTGAAAAGVYVQNTTPADDTLVAYLQTVNGPDVYHAISFIVPLNAYYRISDGDAGDGVTSIYKWFEWYLL